MRKVLAILLVLALLFPANAVPAGAAYHRPQPNAWKPSAGTPLNNSSLTRGLIAAWPMNEAGGKKVLNLLGIPGTFNGTGVHWKNGRFGVSTTLNGGSDYLDSNSSTLADNLPQMSVSIWINTTYAIAGNSEQAIGKLAVGGFSSGAGWCLGIFGTSGVVQFLLQDSGGAHWVEARTANAYNDGKWHHVVWTSAGTTFAQQTIYVDGVVQSLTNFSSGVFSNYSNTLDVQIGWDSGSGSADDRWAGQLDAPMIWNRVLSAAEVQQLYANPFSMMQSPALFFVQPAIVVPAGTGSPSYRRTKYWGTTKPPLGTALNGDSINRGLVSYFVINENGGGYAYDSTLNRYTATLTNAPTWSPGKFGISLKLDGSNTYLSVPVAASQVSTQLTFACWVRPNSRTNIPFLASCRDISFDSAWGIYLSNTGAIGFESRTATGQDTTDGNTAVTDGTWQHIAVTFNAGAVTFYRNGVNTGTASTTGGTIASNGSGFRIGGFNGGGQVLDGWIDLPMVYNRALSAAEIQRLYTQPFAGLQTPQFFFVQPIPSAITRVNGSITIKSGGSGILKFLNGGSGTIKVFGY